MSLLNFSFLSCIVLLISVICACIYLWINSDASFYSLWINSDAYFYSLWIHSKHNSILFNIHVLFNFVDHPHYYSFLGFYPLHYPLMSISRGLLAFVQLHCLVFHISCVSVLGFAHMSPSHCLEVHL
jgi:hypothetical protein